MPDVADLRPDEKRFAKRLAEIRERVGHLEDSQVTTLLKELRAVRGDVVAALSRVKPEDADSWNAFHLNGLESAIADVMRDFTSQYESLLRKGTKEAWELGSEAFPDALAAGGARLPPELQAGLPQLFTDQLETAYNWYPELVRGVADRAKTALGKELRRSITGQETMTATMNRVLKYLDVPTRPTEKFGGLAYQAERLVRTEVGRMFNVANAAGQDHTMDVIGKDGMVRVWLHSGQVKGARMSHVRLHATSVPAKGGKFSVGGYEAEFPQGPGLPAAEVINCRCDHYIWNEAWGPHPVDFPPGSDAAKASVPSPAHDEVVQQRKVEVAPMLPSGADVRTAVMLDQAAVERQRDERDIAMREFSAAQAAHASYMGRGLTPDEMSQADVERKRMVLAEAAFFESTVKVEEARQRVKQRLTKELRVPDPWGQPHHPAGNWSVDRDARTIVDEAMEFVGQIVSQRILPSNMASNPLTIQYNKYYDDRAEYRPPAITGDFVPVVRLNRASTSYTAAHEVGHYVEDAISKFQAEAHPRIVEFLNRRTAGDSWQLYTYNGQPRPDEWVKMDKFHDGGYPGKLYLRGRKTGAPPPVGDQDYTGAFATEVLSVGIERLFRNPVTFMNEDPEWFDLVVDILRGRP